MNQIILDADRYHEIVRHLLGGPQEEAAFVFAKATGHPGAVRFEAIDHYLAGPGDFEFQSRYHITLADATLGTVVQHAWSLDATLVEFHSHPVVGYPIAFSPSDLSGFTEVVPHVRWRLQGRPYAAVVVGPEGFDALAWTGAGDVEEIGHVEVGGATLRPSGNTIVGLRRQHGQYSV